MANICSNTTEHLFALIVISILFSFSFLVSDSESFLVLSFKFVFRIIFIFEMITPLSAQGQQSALSGKRWRSYALIPREEKNICSRRARMRALILLARQRASHGQGRQARRHSQRGEDRQRETHNNTITTIHTTHNDAQHNAHTKHNTIVTYYTQEMHRRVAHHSVTGVLW